MLKITPLHDKVRTCRRRRQQVTVEVVDVADNLQVRGEVTGKIGDKSRRVVSL